MEHVIDVGDSKPIRTKARPLLPGSPKAIAGYKAWKEMEELGIIEKVSPSDQNFWSAALHLETKADLSQRPCGDFRGLNSHTLQDSYQLPDINHFSHHIKKSKIFSRLDLAKAFHFVPIRECDQLKTCVSTPWGLFKFKRMAFGLRNAPMTFQKFADKVFEDIPNVYVYLDDCLVFSDSEEEHLEIITKIFERLQHYGLALSLKKCEFGVAEVDFLGNKISSQGIVTISHLLSTLRTRIKLNYLNMCGSKRCVGTKDVWRQKMCRDKRCVGAK